jgi:hypothetical protein
MRAVHAIPLAVAAFSVSCSEIPPPVDARVHLREGAAVDVPFSVTATGTYDVQLQYPKDRIPQHFKHKPFDRLTGSATLRAGDKKLAWQLPTGWFRLSPFDSTAFGMVLVRFHAYASMSYVLTLHIGRLPEELKDLQGVVSVYKVSPHFHPGHHVYELQ